MDEVCEIPPLLLVVGHLLGEECPLPLLQGKYVCLDERGGVMSSLSMED